MSKKVEITEKDLGVLLEDNFYNLSDLFNDCFKIMVEYKLNIVLTKKGVNQSQSNTIAKLLTALQLIIEQCNVMIDRIRLCYKV